MGNRNEREMVYEVNVGFWWFKICGEKNMFFLCFSNELWETRELSNMRLWIKENLDFEFLGFLALKWNFNIYGVLTLICCYYLLVCEGWMNGSVKIKEKRGGNLEHTNGV